MNTIVSPLREQKLQAGFSPKPAKRERAMQMQQSPSPSLSPTPDSPSQRSSTQFGKIAVPATRKSI